MANLKRCFFIGAFLLLVAPPLVQAQVVNQLVAGEKEKDRAPSYLAERQFIESTLQTIVTVIQTATVDHESSGLGTRIRELTANLAEAAKVMGPTATPGPVSPQNDLDDLRRILQDITDQLDDIREALEEQESYDLADQVGDVRRDLRRAVREVDRMDRAADADEEYAVSTEDGNRWLRPGQYDTKIVIRDEGEDDDDDDDWYRHRSRRSSKKGKYRGTDWWRHTGTFVGGYSFRWPYRRETALYNSAPAIRYNRVEGLTLGVGRRPLDWNSYGRATIYGHAGYAFELNRWRATIGAETRVDGRRNDSYGLKVGASYRYNTDTRDSWKTSWLENSLAAFFFENDFFDYHQVEGWTLYAVQRISPYLQVSAGYRDEDYQSLDKNTGWSLFKGDGFFENPLIDEGDMNSFVFALEGGRVAGLHSLPRGAAFRVEAEFSDGLGSDFAFNRYIADGRVYLPVTSFSSLGLRMRGGLTTGDFIPLQKQFTIGGIGTARGYTQNSIIGTRMLLANAEYVVDDVDFFDVLDDLQLIGFADFAWVNAYGTDELDFDDVLPTAGFGLGLDDRDVRLELAFPLRDLGNGHSPSLWLRITPSF